MGVAFGQLGSQINAVFKEQNATVTVSSAVDKKKDDKKKWCDEAGVVKNSKCHFKN